MGKKKEVETYKCNLCQFITKHKHNVKRHFASKHRADHYDEAKIETIKLDSAKDNNKKPNEDKTISKVPPKKAIKISAKPSKPKIRIVFMCHTCFDEFSSRHERDIHKCVPSEDNHIEELEDLEEIENQQEEPVVTFPDEDDEDVGPNLGLEHILEDPMAINCLYKCPICLDKFVDVQKHMNLFHRITLEDQNRLRNEGLLVTEINVSHL